MRCLWQPQRTYMKRLKCEPKQRTHIAAESARAELLAPIKDR